MGIAYFFSPLGFIELKFKDHQLSGLRFTDNISEEQTIDQSDEALLMKTEELLSLYFLGKNVHFDLPLLLDQSDFNQYVYKELQKIPSGQKITYSQMAMMIQKPRAIRPVASAMRKNKHLIIIPCHRVIGKHHLGGYSGNPWRKKYLLSLENGDYLSLGLNANSVNLVKYQSVWKNLFNIEREAILSVCSVDPVQIEHIGSTSIPGLQSKPIIDIMLGIKKNQEKETIHQLKLIGYQYRANFNPDEWHFLSKGINEHITHHLHICHYQSDFYNQHIHFRDIVLSNPKVLKEYQDLKQNLEMKYSNDRKSYTQAKTEFILDVLKRYKS